MVWAQNSSHWTTQRQLELLRKKTGTHGRSFRFTVFGDSRPEVRWLLKPFYPPEKSEAVFETFLGEMGKLHPNFSLHTGDLVARGTPEEYVALFQTLDQKVSWPFFTVIGNHELLKTPEGKTEAEFEKALGPANYSFDFEGFRFIAVDTSHCKLTSKDLEWLKGALDTPLRKIVFTHVPPKEIVQWADVLPIYGIGLGYGSKTFVDLMTQYRVDRVYLGHLHGFGVVDYNGVRYVLSAGAGAPFRPWLPVHRKFFNFILVDVADSGQLNETVYSLDSGGRVQSRPLASYKPTEKL